MDRATDGVPHVSAVGVVPIRRCGLWSGLRRWCGSGLGSWRYRCRLQRGGRFGCRGRRSWWLRRSRDDAGQRIRDDALLDCPVADAKGSSHHTDDGDRDGGDDLWGELLPRFVRGLRGRFPHVGGVADCRGGEDLCNVGFRRCGLCLNCTEGERTGEDHGECFHGLKF